MSYIIDENTICLLHFDDNFTDSINNIEPDIKNGDTFSIVKDGKFKGGLKGLEGSGSKGGYLSYNLPQTNLKTYTIDLWVYIDEKQINGTFQFLCINTTNSSQKLGLYKNGSKYYFTLWSDNGNDTKSEVKINDYNHIAVVSNGTTTEFYINGVKSTRTVSNVTPLNKVILGQAYSSNMYPNCILDEVRVSDVVRYTDNFTPNNRPYSNPMYPNVLNSTELLCSIINEMDLDTLEVYVNGVLDKTYNSLNANSITIHKYNLNLINASDNTIKVVGYKEGVEYPVTFMYKYLPPLSSIASLNTIINRLQSLLERQEKENSIFISILKEKGVTDDLNGLRYEELMEYVRCLGVYTPPNKPVVTDKPVITGIETAFSQYKIYVDTKGLITEDTRVDLYIDDTLHSDRTFSVSGGYVNFNTISSDDVILNKEIYLDFRNGITTEKYLVNLITLSIESIEISKDI